MASFTATRRHRLALGAAIFVAGTALLVARPGVAFAHHVTVSESGDCAGWESKAEYFGGDGDRKVVIDVTLNAEHLSTTLYFDAAHGTRTEYAMLFERAGSGSVHTSGTVTMYEKAGASYSSVVNSARLAMNFDCALPTSTATATATLVPPTSTVVQSTATPRSTQTPTAKATDIATNDAVTPLPTATATPVTTSAPTTPESTSTAVTTGSLATPGPKSTPTLVNIVHSSRRPNEPLEPAATVDRALPDTGQGAHAAGAILAGLLGTLVAAAGLGVCAGGLRARRHH